jgi:DNA-binding response OmpR family regulator
MPKILLIDDSAELCNGLAEIFRDEGYLVDNTSDSGNGAILIKKNRYDVGIFDYKMKGLNGIDLLKMIKGVNPQCPVFIVSADSSINWLIKKEKLAGLVAGIISKPFNIVELLQKIKSIEQTGAGLEVVSEPDSKMVKKRRVSQ